MAIVLPLSTSVETYATAGREVEVEVPTCPDCASSMGRWSGYWRFVREATTCVKIFVVRARCAACRRTHALLPAFCLRNRLDVAEAIGGVVEAVAGGTCGVRPVALSAGVPHTTARGWVRAFGANARRFQAAFFALSVELGGEVVSVGADPVLGALGAIRVAFDAASALSGWASLGLWRFVSAVSGGGLLAPNTNSPYLIVGRRRFMPPVP
jgi:hypothetical protein